MKTIGEITKGLLQSETEINKLINDWVDSHIKGWEKFPAHCQAASEWGKDIARHFFDLGRRAERTLIGAQIKSQSSTSNDVLPVWRKIKDETHLRYDHGFGCITHRPILLAGWIDKNDYRIVPAGSMVNKEMYCIPIEELEGLPIDGGGPIR